MFSLFFSKNNNSISITNSKLDWLLLKLGLQVRRLKNYYYSRNFYIDRPNILVSLLEHLPVRYDSSKEELSDIDIYDVPINDLVSIKSKGRILANNVFVNVSEIFEIHKGDWVNMDEINYLDFSPIKCLYHTLDNIGPIYPKDYDYASEVTDYAVFSIDITILSQQFFFWLNEQVENDKDTDPARYVASVLLPNLIDSITNISLINRFIRLTEDVENVNVITNINGIYDLSSKIDEELLRLHKKLDTKPMYYTDYLYNIPDITSNILHTLSLSNIPFNSQNEWLVYFTRFPYVNYLLSLDKLKTMNKPYITELKNEIKQIRRSVLPKLNDHYVIKSILETEIQEAERRF